MRLPEICIRRPVFATVLNLLIILLGFLAYDRLAVREYPNIDAPVLTVETTYRGASAQIIESQVTEPLEDALSGLEGFDYMTSVSRQEKSQVTLTFKIDRDLDAAASDVRDRVARARAQLPDDVDDPIVAKVEADALPIIYLAFSSDRHTPLETTDIVERQVRDRIAALPGVAQVQIYGERRYAMRVWLDPARLSAYGLTPLDVETALRGQNLEVPAGRVEGQMREFTVSGNTDLQTPAQFGAVVLKQSAGYLVRLGDVARIEEAAADDRVLARLNGRSAVAMGVIKQSNGNPLDVSRALTKIIPDIQSTLPEGLRLEIGYDRTVFIDRSIDAVYRTIAEAVLFVLLVIVLFLRTWRATLIPLVTIPISLIGAFAVMALLGFSVNTLTLLALVLAVGLVVDDAIVVVENIQRHIEDGMTPFAAAMQGSREIAFAVLAMSVTLAAVFAPMALTEGTVGRLFTEFALTLAGAVLISGFIALTLSPMMCARLLRHETASSGWARKTEGWLSALTSGYGRMLGSVLMRRGLIVLVLLLTAAGGVGLYRLLPKELVPVEDRGLVVGFALAPEGSTIAYTDQYARQMEQFFASIPEVERTFFVIGFPLTNQALSFAVLKDWSQRYLPQQAVTGQLFGMFMSMPGVLAFPINPPSLGERTTSQPVDFVLQSTVDYPQLEVMAQQVLGAVMAQGVLTNPDLDLKLTKPELQFTINRDKAQLLGIDVAAIGRTLQTMLSGAEVTRYKRGGDQYDVIVQVEPDARRLPRDMSAIFMRAADGTMVQLSSLLTVNEVAAPRELNHFNKLRAVKITAGLAPGVSLGQALDALEQATRATLGDKVLIDYDGQSREFRTTSAALLLAFVMALVFIYLVLAAQYESYIDPLTIMLSVPLALAGALATIYLVGGTLNVYSQIGLITLIGLITKHGILIVEFANQNRVQGDDVITAVQNAAVLRLRPILMTTAATILAAVPLALAGGAGAEGRQQIGWVIVGGMSFGTVLTLFVVPVAYVLLARLRRGSDNQMLDAH